MFNQPPQPPGHFPDNGKWIPTFPSIEEMLEYNKLYRPYLLEGYYSDDASEELTQEQLDELEENYSGKYDTEPWYKDTIDPAEYGKYHIQVTL